MSKYTYVSDNARQSVSVFATDTFAGINLWPRTKAAEKSGSLPQSSKAKHTEVKIMESFKNTQEQRILSYMEEFGSITQMEAFFESIGAKH